MGHSVKMQRAALLWRKHNLFDVPLIVCQLRSSRESKVHRLVFFWRYDEQQNRMEALPALIEQLWPGIPSPIDAAVFYEGSATHGLDSRDHDIAQMMWTLHFFPNRFCASVPGKHSLQVWSWRQAGGLNWTRQWSSGVPEPKRRWSKLAEDNRVTHEVFAMLYWCVLSNQLDAHGN